VHEHCVKRY